MYIGYIPILLMHPRFPQLASFPCVFVPPTREAWRDARKPCEERGNEEISFKRNETSCPLKRHVKQRPFLMTAAADRSWISCQLVLIAIETLDGVCVWTVLIILIKTQFSLAEQQCFLSVACYLFNKHLHMNNSCRQSVFILWTESCLEAQEPSLLAQYLYIIYSLLASVFIDILIVNSLFNNPEYDWCLLNTGHYLLGWMFQGKCKWYTSYQTRHSGIISLTCDWMEMKINNVTGVCCWQTDSPSLSDFNSIINKS